MVSSSLRFSFITPTLNSVATVADTIESVRREAHRHLYEHIIVDGESNDGTLEMIQAENDQHIRCESGPDSGVYDAMNKGIGLSRGEIIAIINSDDFYLADAIDTVAKAFESDPHVGVIHGNVVVRRPQGDKYLKPYPLALSRYGIGYPMWHPAVFVRRHVYDAVGVYDCQYTITADQDFFLRILDRGISTKHVPATLTEMRAGGLSTEFYTTATKELLQIYRTRGGLAGRVSHAIYYSKSRLRTHPETASGIHYPLWALRNFVRCDWPS